MMNPDDEHIYAQFLALPGSIMKYLGIRGFEFSDPSPTRNTWSDMSKNTDNRKAFVDSLLKFLEK